MKQAGRYSGPVGQKKRLTAQQESARRNLRRIWEEKKKDLGLTQQKIADRLGVTQGAVSHYLNGVNPLGQLQALRFAKILQVDPGEIMDMTSLAIPHGESVELTPRQAAVLNLIEWLDDGEYQSLVQSLEKAKRDKLSTYEFVRVRGGQGE